MPDSITCPLCESDSDARRQALDEAIAEIDRMRADHEGSTRSAYATLDMAADRLRTLRDRDREPTT